MIERLSGEYNRGYTRAIMDLQSIFKYVETELAMRHKKLSSKLANELLECCLINREALRESEMGCGEGFIRWNVQKNGFEFFDPKKKEKE